MKLIKYFLQFIIIIFFFVIFKILGYKKSSDLGAYIFSKLGHLFRSKKVLNQNLRNINLSEYGSIDARYLFMRILGVRQSTSGYHGGVLSPN